MNTLSVQLTLAKLAREAGEPIDEALLSSAAPDAPARFNYFLKLALLAYKYSGLFSLALKDPKLLQRLQRLSNQYSLGAKQDPAKARVERNEALANEPALLFGLKTEEEFWELMAASPSVLDDFKLTRQLLSWFRQTADDDEDEK
jgi:hypothetical protein